MINDEEMKRIAEYEEYRAKIDLFFPANEAENKDMRLQLEELFIMGFLQFQANSMILKHYKGDLNLVCQTLLDTEGDLERIINIVSSD